MKTSDLYLLISNEIEYLENYALNFTKNEDRAKDLIQDTMVKAITNIEKFECGTNLKGWLYTIMRNTFINDYRRYIKIRNLVTQSDEITSSNLSYSATKNNGEQRIIIEDIKKALIELPEDYYLPFTLHFDGFKYQEIAEKLNVPLGTVKTRIHAARKLLKQSLKQYCEVYVIPASSF